MPFHFGVTQASTHLCAKILSPLGLLAVSPARRLHVMSGPLPSRRQRAGEWGQTLFSPQCTPFLLFLSNGKQVPDLKINSCMQCLLLPPSLCPKALVWQSSASRSFSQCPAEPPFLLVDPCPGGCCSATRCPPGLERSPGRGGRWGPCIPLCTSSGKRLCWDLGSLWDVPHWDFAVMGTWMWGREARQDHTRGGQLQVAGGGRAKTRGWGSRGGSYWCPVLSQFCSALFYTRF